MSTGSDLTGSTSGPDIGHATPERIAAFVVPPHSAKAEWAWVRGNRSVTRADLSRSVIRRGWTEDPLARERFRREVASGRPTSPTPHLPCLQSVRRQPALHRHGAVDG